MISLPLIIAIFFVALFGVIAVIFSIRDDRIRRRLEQKEKTEKLSLFEAAVLKQIHASIGYSLDPEKIAGIIASNVANFTDYSTVSTLLIINNELKAEINIKEPVGKIFIDQVKAFLMQSLSAMTQDQVSKIYEEKIKGVQPDEKLSYTPQSFFNIPIGLNGKTYGVINVASRYRNFYTEPEMTELYKITESAMEAVGHLQEIIIKEDGKLTAMMSSLDTSVFMIAKDNKLIMINEAAKEILKIQKANPTYTDILSSLPNSYNFADKIAKAISLNQKIEEKNIRLYDKFINVVIVPIAESSSEKETKVTGASFFIHDATPEKSLAKMKEDFTNIIVHELRSPLTSIKASSEMLNGENTLTEEEKKRLIGIVYDQTCKMLNEVSMILDAAKLDSGLFTVHKVSGDLKKVISDSAESFRSSAQNKFLNLVTNIDPFMPQVSFDAPEIKRVITNLIANSLKFTPGGGTITVRAWTTPEKIYVSVSDTGMGIPFEKQHLLFAKFAQIQTPNATIGTGLGLYIAKGIIDAHNGTIGVQSTPGKGTVVTFTIPTSTPVQTTAVLTASPNKPFSPLAN